MKFSIQGRSQDNRYCVWYKRPRIEWKKYYSFDSRTLNEAVDEATQCWRAWWEGNLNNTYALAVVSENEAPD